MKTLYTYGHLVDPCGRSYMMIMRLVKSLSETEVVDSRNARYPCEAYDD